MVTVERQGQDRGQGQEGPVPGATVPLAPPPAPPVLLVVDPDPAERVRVATTLSVEGFHLLTSPGGDDAVLQARSTTPALILLSPCPGRPDAGAEAEAGTLTLFRRLVAAAPGVPLIVVSGLDDDPDAVRALEWGAADHVTGPLRAREPAARVRAVLRRVVVPDPDPTDRQLGAGPGTGADGIDEPGTVSAGPVRLDRALREVEVRGEPVDLSGKELDLLELLMVADGNVVTREQCMERIWRNRARGDSRTLDTHVKRLRRKIELEPAEPRHLLTVRGIGYRFTP